MSNKVQHLSIPISALVAHDKNYRLHPEEQLTSLQKSLEEFDQVRSIVVQAQANGQYKILAGHGITEAARRAGITEMSCDVVPATWSDAKALAYIAADNQSGYEDDQRALAALLKQIQDDNEISLEAVGYTHEQLDAMLASLADFDYAAEGDDNNNKAKGDGAGDKDFGERKTKVGQIWQLGNHYLVVGDSFDPQILQSALSLVASPTLEFSDPPYRLGSVGGGIIGDSQRIVDIKDNKLDEFDPSRLTMVADTAVFCCNKPLVPDYIALAKNLGISWDLGVYHKTNAVPNYGGHLMTDVEYWLLLGQQGPKPGLPKTTYSKVFSGGLDEGAEIAWAKPVELVVKFIELYTEPGDVVVDRFGGSGTTLVACEQTGRVALLFEVEPKYADMILGRFETATGLPAKLTKPNKAAK